MSNVILFPSTVREQRKHIRDALAELINYGECQLDEIYIKLAALIELLDRAEYKLNKTRQVHDDE